MIDTHAHIYSSQFEDVRTIVQNAQKANISKIILPAVDSHSHEKLFEIALQFPNYLFPTIGLHPTSVNDFVEKNGCWETEILSVEQFLLKYRKTIVAIGEIGLDYYWSEQFVEQQKQALTKQLGIAKRENLPAILHVRPNKNNDLLIWDDILSIIENSGVEKGVFHSFTGSYNIVERIMELKGDWLFGVNGVLTFKNSTMPEVYKNVPLNKLVFETDAPYLAPTPYRGKRNEPAYITEIALKLAAVKELPIEQLTLATTENVERVFGI